MSSSTDRIERQIWLKAPRSRVGRALSNAQEFGAWFGLGLSGGTFTPGQRVQGRATYPGYEHLVCELLIERVEPANYLSWHWHPAAIERGVDYSQEPMTLVVFELGEVDGGTSLRLIESGFDQIPAPRRRDAFRINGSGWDEQMQNIERHVAAS
ncbi:MAG TPA: SRPBCC family protein [Steroidobacteraceae bacterium]